MKHINNIIGIAALSLALGLTSCTDYLDKTPDSDVNPETAFKNFTNFQGFVEEIYNCIPNKESCSAVHPYPARRTNGDSRPSQSEP